MKKTTKTANLNKLIKKKKNEEEDLWPPVWVRAREIGKKKKKKKDKERRRQKVGFVQERGKKSHLGGKKKLSVLFTLVSTTNFNIFTIMWWVTLLSFTLYLEVLRERKVEGRRVVEMRVERNGYSLHYLDVFKIK